MSTGHIGLSLTVQSCLLMCSAVGVTLSKFSNSALLISSIAKYMYLVFLNGTHIGICCSACWRLLFKPFSVCLTVFYQISAFLSPWYVKHTKLFSKMVFWVLIFMVSDRPDYVSFFFFLLVSYFLLVYKYSFGSHSNYKQQRVIVNVVFKISFWQKIINA